MAQASNIRLHLAANRFYASMFLRERPVGTAIRLASVLLLTLTTVYMFNAGAWADREMYFYTTIGGVLLLVLSGVFRQMKLHRQRNASLLRSLPVPAVYWALVELFIGGLILILAFGFFLWANHFAGFAQTSDIVQLMILLLPVIPLLRWAQCSSLNSGLIYSLVLLVAWVVFASRFLS